MRCQCRKWGEGGKRFVGVLPAKEGTQLDRLVDLVGNRFRRRFTRVSHTVLTVGISLLERSTHEPNENSCRSTNVTTFE